jgi:DNA-binding HxlR family transcriptional regulator
MQGATANQIANEPRDSGAGHFDGSLQPECCPRYQEAVELVGRRWTGAILSVLVERPLRFSEIAAAVPDLSDRLLSARLRELEDRGVVVRQPCSERASSVRYALSDMGRDLEPALDALQAWANRWLGDCKA